MVHIEKECLYKSLLNLHTRHIYLEKRILILPDGENKIDEFLDILNKQALPIVFKATINLFLIYLIFKQYLKIHEIKMYY